jgi:hypothetical protein
MTNFKLNNDKNKLSDSGWENSYLKHYVILKLNEKA